MIKTYNYEAFGNRLSKVRKGQGYTQKEVSTLSGVSLRTIINIESGKGKPRLDILESIGQVYGINIFRVLELYSISGTLYTFYDDLDNLILSGNKASVEEAINTFNALQKNNLELIDVREMTQIDLFMKALLKSYENHAIAYNETIDLLIKAFKVKHDSFYLDQFKNYQYSHLEMRLLFLVASMKGVLRDCEISNALLSHILTYLDQSEYAQVFEKQLIAKCYSTISYNYFREFDHLSSLSYAQEGIDYCLNNNILYRLPLLLVRKGVAYCMSGDEATGFEAFDQALSLLKLSNNEETYQVYLEIAESKYKYILPSR